ncbi:hypothetical protein J2S00_004058 [Caldalkalibacillus uzonensis]|uniref:Uncharacterized protein n=1 Tax=Caldalkalibacillus uzonensis TaxID=353224 RepID=A0ABU0CYH9_9BACI|nr:hypothetical protein [Caldalkalibacillus uzonensis]MDQ0341199.1 hypothetical protein [Caldalkalibacillus uzonensis]
MARKKDSCDPSTDYFADGDRRYQDICKKELPDNNYTLFDYITGHTLIEFHEEKEEPHEEDGKGEK